MSRFWADIRGLPKPPAKLDEEIYNRFIEMLTKFDKGVEGKKYAFRDHLTIADFILAENFKNGAPLIGFDW